MPNSKTVQRLYVQPRTCLCRRIKVADWHQPPSHRSQTRGRQFQCSDSPCPIPLRCCRRPRSRSIRSLSWRRLPTDVETAWHHTCSTLPATAPLLAAEPPEVVRERLDARARPADATSSSTGSDTATRLQVDCYFRLLQYYFRSPDVDRGCSRLPVVALATLLCLLIGWQDTTIQNTQVIAARAQSK